MPRLGSRSGTWRPSRVRRRLHALAGWVRFLPETLGALVAAGEARILDRLPGPVCRRARARRCRTVRGRASCGSCAATREPGVGGRLPLRCTAAGVPVACDVLPAGWHDLTPVHALPCGLPADASVSSEQADDSRPDEATILAETTVRLVPIRKATMVPNTWADTLALRAHRQRIEPANSRLEALGVQRLHARATAGRQLKLHASVLALACTNAS